MTGWSVILKKFGIEDIVEPDCWQLLGISSSHSDKTLIDAALASRRRVLAGLEMSTDRILLQSFESDVLLPAYFAACEALNNVDHLPSPHPDNRRGVEEEQPIPDNIQDDDTEEISLKELPYVDEPVVMPWLADDPEDNGREYQLQDDDTVGLKPQELSYDEPEAAPASANTAKPGYTNMSDEPIKLEELIGDGATYHIASGDNGEIPLLSDAGSGSDQVGSVDAGQTEEDIPVLEALPEDFNAITPMETPDEQDDEPDGGDRSTKKRFFKSRPVLYVLALIPILTVLIFICILFSIDNKAKKATVIEPEPLVQNITTDKSKNVAQILKNQVVDSGFVAQEVPERFSYILEKLQASFSSGSDQLAMLEDIAITFQAWQLIAGNITDTSAFGNILDSQLFRDNKLAFDLEEYHWKRLGEILRASDNEPDIALEYFTTEMNSSDLVRIRRMIELACVTGSEPLRNKMLAYLAAKVDIEISSRIVRSFCCWLSPQDQYEMLGYVSSSRRELSRRIFDNLNVRYSEVLASNSEKVRFLPYAFTRQEMEACLKWWQANLISIGSAGNPPMATPMATGDDAELRYAALLAGVWKNSYILGSVLRGSVDLPLLSPDMEISRSRQLAVNHIFADSLNQVKNGLLAVIYDQYAGQEILRDIDLIRFGSLEYDFIDTDLCSQARANEILIYCKIMNGQRYESDKVNRYDQKANTLLLVRDALFESLKFYASSKIARYDRPAADFNLLDMSIAVDFDLVSKYNFTSNTAQGDSLEQILVELRNNPFSVDLYNKARALSQSRDNVDSESLIYLQLGLKALVNRKFGSGISIAIDCFQHAMALPLGKEVITRNLPDMAEVLSENPGYLCPDCGNSGYTTCPACKGSLFTICEVCRGDGMVTVKGQGRQVCANCGGIGKICCGNCNGSGVIRCEHCNDYISDIELFLPDQYELARLRQAINLSALIFNLEVSEESD